MKRLLLALTMVIAFAWAGAPALADGADAAKVKGKAKAEKAKDAGAKRTEQAQDAAGETVDEAKEAGEAPGDEAKKAPRRGKGNADDAHEAMTDDADEATTDDAAEGAAKAGKGAERDVPPGMAKREAHPSTGKGSEKGQEARAKNEKPWWSFWN